MTFAFISRLPLTLPISKSISYSKKTIKPIKPDIMRLPILMVTALAAVALAFPAPHPQGENDPNLVANVEACKDKKTGDSCTAAKAEGVKVKGKCDYQIFHVS